MIWGYHYFRKHPHCYHSVLKAPCFFLLGLLAQAPWNMCPHSRSRTTGMAYLQWWRDSSVNQSLWSWLTFNLPENLDSNVSAKDSAQMAQSFSAREGSCKLGICPENMRSSAKPVVCRLDSRQLDCISLCISSWQEPCPERRLSPQRPHHFAVRPRHQSRETAEAEYFGPLTLLLPSNPCCHGDLSSTTTGLHASFSWTGTALRRTNRRFFFFWSTCFSVFWKEGFAEAKTQSVSC